MAYLLDANVFIQGSRFHYRFEFCPGFWDWILREHAAGNVFSIEKVGNEIEAGNDLLADWARARGPTFFLPPGPPVLPALATVASWVKGQKYTSIAISDFLQVADYHLVAAALAGGYTLVTHEKAAPSLNRVKIPSVCVGVGVKVMTPFEMLTHERPKFVLGP